MKYGCPKCFGHVEIDQLTYGGEPLGCPHCQAEVVFSPMDMEIECPPVLPPPTTPTLAEMAAGQPLGEVAEALAELKHYCTSNENVVGIALQSRLMTAGMKTDFIAVTERRVIVLNRGIFGRKMWDTLWVDVLDVKIEEGITGASLRVHTTNGRVIIIEKLHKGAARTLYRYCQSCEEKMRAVRYAYRLEEAAVGATRINLNLGNKK